MNAYVLTIDLGTTTSVLSVSTKLERAQEIASTLTRPPISGWRTDPELPDHWYADIDADGYDGYMIERFEVEE